jgi:hypothetical protein
LSASGRDPHSFEDRANRRQGSALGFGVALLLALLVNTGPYRGTAWRVPWVGSVVFVGVGAGRLPTPVPGVALKTFWMGD